jgi:hypothetical protein
LAQKPTTKVAIYAGLAMQAKIDNDASGMLLWRNSRGLSLCGACCCGAAAEGSASVKSSATHILFFFKKK